MNFDFFFFNKRKLYLVLEYNYFESMWCNVVIRGMFLKKFLLSLKEII